MLKLVDDAIVFKRTTSEHLHIRHKKRTKVLVSLVNFIIYLCRFSIVYSFCIYSFSVITTSTVQKWFLDVPLQLQTSNSLFLKKKTRCWVNNNSINKTRVCVNDVPTVKYTNWCEKFERQYVVTRHLDHLQPTSIFISIFFSKIEKLYYKGGFAPMYASIIEFLYL